jgi:outer membrane protein assembly factor BamB
MNRRLYLGLATALLAWILVSGVSAAPQTEAGGRDWPGWRGPNGNGIASETDWSPEALRGGAKILWRVNVGRGHSNVAILGGRLYTMGLADRKVVAHCLDAATGREIWRCNLDVRFYEPNSTPAVSGDSVYLLTGDGTLLCLRANNGKIRWQKSLNKDFRLQPIAQGWSTSPVVEGDLLLVNANKKQLALDTRSGDLIWSLDDEKPIGSYGSHASPVVFDRSGSRGALFMGPGRLNAVIADSGELSWSFLHNDPWHPIADPVVIGKRVFISLHDGCYMLEADEAEPRILWESPVLCSDIATAVVVDGYLYGTDFAERLISANDWNSMRRYEWPLRCVDVETGAVVWEQPMEHSNLIAADGKLILLGMKGTLRIAEAAPTGYMELATGDVSGSKENVVFATPPVLCDGMIYCRNYLGDLICVDVRN